MTPILLALAVPPPCAQPVTGTALQATVDEALARFERLDIDAFEAATETLEVQIPCLREALTRNLAADIHRVKGIRAVGDRDPLADHNFAAARSLEPAYTLPRTLVPDGNPIRLHYGAFDLSTGTFADAAPADGQLMFDGRRTQRRPESWPTLAQYSDPQGAVQWTVWLAPGAALPSYPLQPEERVVVPAVPMPDPDATPIPEAAPTVQARSARGPLLGAALAAGVATGVFYGVAGVTEVQFNDPDTPDSDLDALRTRANSLVIVSGFTGAAAVGLTVAGIAAR